MDMKYIINEQQLELLIELHSPKGKEIKPSRNVFHKSKPSNRDSILKYGLLVSVGDCYFEYVGSEECEPAIFATDTKLKEALFDTTYDDDIWLINTDMANVTWYKDKHFEKFQHEYKHIVTFQDIPPTAIKLIYKGSGRSKY